MHARDTNVYLSVQYTPLGIYTSYVLTYDVYEKNCTVEYPSHHITLPRRIQTAR